MTLTYSIKSLVGYQGISARFKITFKILIYLKTDDDSENSNFIFEHKNPVNKSLIILEGIRHYPFSPDHFFGKVSIREAFFVDFGY